MEARKRVKSGFLYDYGLSVTLGLLFLVSWSGQAAFQWIEFAHDQQARNQVADLAGFIPVFLSATFENWQSEFQQVLIFVVLTACLYHKGSHESKDNDEEMDAALVRIERRLDSLGAKFDEFASDAEKAEFEHLKHKVEHTRKRNTV